MTLSVQKYILWFEISVYYILIMKCFYSTNDLSCIQFGSLFVELLLFTQVSEELSTVEEVDEEIQFAFCLESIVQANDVWVLYFFKDVSLS